MKTLSFNELKEMQEGDDDFLLIDVLPAETFEKDHIPGSLSVPEADPDFVSQVEEIVEGKESKIVVYCGSIDCPVSRRAAEKLDKAGFSNVYAFEGGLEEWHKKSGTAQQSVERVDNTRHL